MVTGTNDAGSSRTCSKYENGMAVRDSPMEITAGRNSNGVCKRGSGSVLLELSCNEEAARENRARCHGAGRAGGPIP